MRSVPANVAADPVAAPLRRRLAHAPERVPLAPPAPHSDPVDLGPVVSSWQLADPPQPLGILQSFVHSPQLAQGPSSPPYDRLL